MELLHILNRGVEGRNLFLDSQDYVRFVHNLYEFNDSELADASSRRKGLNVGSTRPYIHDKIVEILGPLSFPPKKFKERHIYLYSLFSFLEITYCL